ncbi:2-dehydro-3-deoxygluconokinase [Noviherbaspirillum pedocola]|uniref:2-dehydro-3-deoxygluconokinase n=1 Tax=Noviherbaspirillum pedocola TaxID=2801341 RepID=A0A934W768_9BURK|nr:sugar kinase [Noviherbaspirillum pedocola]MBK4734334.1 sugar kinase [Noviherbaspirillum pedocola]
MQTEDTAQHTIFVIGECMVELQRNGSGMTYRFGGDTLNAAVYLARLLDPARFAISYVTGLGKDTLSEEMCAAWQAEGIGTDCVQRFDDKLPGMYLIETDARGERRFHYWRNDSAARFWLRGPQTEAVLARLFAADVIYLSGISLAILPPEDRERLFDLLARCRMHGSRIVFDNNYRPRLWPDATVAADAYRKAMAVAHTALLTLDDEAMLYGDADPAAALARARALGVSEIVIKRGADACIAESGGLMTELAAEPVADVVDTTAAGDSFGAAYLAARLAGMPQLEAVRAGHRLAAAVIRHPGAIIPRSAMP